MYRVGGPIADSGVVVQRFCQVKWKGLCQSERLTAGCDRAGATVDGEIGRLGLGAGVLADSVAVYAQLT